MLIRSLFTNTQDPFVCANGNPFVVMSRARHSADTASHASAVSVRLDVHEDETAFYVTADLPGLSESEVEVTFDDGKLSISGEKKLERDEKQGTWHITERAKGRFARNLSLPTPVDANKIEAHFNKGVLSLTLPKLPEAPSAKKINIKTVN